jgi:hypothetical protein
MSHAHTPQVHNDDRYEKTDAHFGPIAKFIAWLGFGTALVLVSMWAMLVAMKKLPLPNSDVALHPLAIEHEIPAEPRLEALRGVHKKIDGTVEVATDPQYFNTRMWKDWNSKWSTDLKSYQWLDQSAGVARIPIERAMELKLKKGYPTAVKPKN